MSRKRKNKFPQPTLVNGKIVYPDAKVVELKTYTPTPIKERFVDVNNKINYRFKKKCESKYNKHYKFNSFKSKTFSYCNPHLRRLGNYILYYDGIIRNTKTNNTVKNPALNDQGYATYGGHLIHRLMAEAWLKNPDPDIFTEVNHIDKNRSNNNIENLEWISRKDNMLHKNGKPYWSAPRFYTHGW